MKKNLKMTVLYLAWDGQTNVLPAAASLFPACSAENEFVILKKIKGNKLDWLFSPCCRTVPGLICYDVHSAITMNVMYGALLMVATRTHDTIGETEQVSMAWRHGRTIATEPRAA
jgi:hypothetical protein